MAVNIQEVLLDLINDPEVSNISVNHWSASDEELEHHSSSPSCGHCGTQDEAKLRFCTGCHLVRTCPPISVLLIHTKSATL